MRENPVFLFLVLGTSYENSFIITKEVNDILVKTIPFVALKWFCSHQHLVILVNQGVHGKHRCRSNLYITKIHILVFFHYFAEHFWSVLRRITIINEAYFYVLFQLITNSLVIEPISKRRFGINYFTYLTCKAFALFINNNTVHFLVFTIDKVVLISERNQNIIECLFFKGYS